MRALFYSISSRSWFIIILVLVAIFGLYFAINGLYEAMMKLTEPLRQGK